MIKKSYAKINFSINIIDKLENGYHSIDMIMSKINFYDKLYFSLLPDDEIHITCTNMFIPTDEKNLVYQIAAKFKREFNISDGIRIHIAKSIPMQAGLGGGSSNAATTLEALNEMFNTNLTLDEKIMFSKEFGADIPFFFYNSTCRVQGIGDVISPIENNLDSFYLILVKPQRGISTRLVYENVNLETCDHPDNDKLVEALKENDYNYIVNNIKNSLEQSAMELRPIIRDLKAELEDIGVDCTLVCGSGSTIFAMTKDAEIAKKVKQDHVNKKNFVYITRLK